MSAYEKYFKLVIIVLLFVLAGSLFLHNLISINLDIGRHLKLGEIIWETKSIPDTNLFSYTEPDHPFVNHHWLSEVIFYGLYMAGGWPMLIVAKVFILCLALFFLLKIIKHRPVWLIVGSFLITLLLFYSRSEPRPEIFSFLLLAAFLFVLYRVRSGEYAEKYLWLLPILQIIWANAHIYFFLGPALFLFFAVEWIFQGKPWKKIIWPGVALGLASLINPNGWWGALYPLFILKEYGYGVIENEPLSKILAYGADKIVIFGAFMGTFMWSVVSLVARAREYKKNIFNWLTLLFLAYLSWRIQRNLGLFALGVMPIIALTWRFPQKVILSRSWSGLTAIVILVGLLAATGLVASDWAYRRLDVSRRFGWKVSVAAEEGVEFIKREKITGPVFNNFEIGSYLIWGLYPDQKVFVDGRPEAYSANFFNTVYKPMLGSEQQWEKWSREYGINYIFFNHNSLSDNAQQFLLRINKDQRWALVFLNETAVIYVQNNKANRELIVRQGLDKSNIWPRMESIITRFDKGDDLEFRPLASILFFLNMPEASVKVYEVLQENLPGNPYAYQGAGLVYATMANLSAQAKAADNLEKAVELGLGSSNNFFTLGLVYANLGQNEKARQALNRVRELEPENGQVQEILKML